MTLNKLKYHRTIKHYVRCLYSRPELRRLNGMEQGCPCMTLSMQRISEIQRPGIPEPLLRRLAHGKVIRRHQDHLRIRIDPDPNQPANIESYDSIPLPEIMEIPLFPSDLPQPSQPQEPARQPVESMAPTKEMLYTET